MSSQLVMAAKENADLGEAAAALKRVQQTEKPEEQDKPRFTLPELKEILQERNSLKARVSDLEDELSMYRPRKQS